MTGVLTRSRGDAIRLSLENPPITWLSAGLFIACFAVLLNPPSWTGNEIGYFDLAHRWIDPGHFSDSHAIKDSSNARIVSFMVMGFGIEWFGMEGAYRAFRLLFMIISPIAFLALARALKAPLPAAAFTLLLLFGMGHQSVQGGEYVFGSIEPKSFAYPFVLVGLASALDGRRVLASLAFAIAVYFHFLVGAFWAAAAFGFYLLQDRSLWRSWRVIGLFVGLVTPLLVAILMQRSGEPTGLVDASMPSLNAIYAEFRNPHHLAPFISTKVFFANWFWGLCLHGALAISFWVFSLSRADRERLVSQWLAVLNLYVILAATIAFFDRETHAFGLLYLFRPSALILILSILWVAIQMFKPPALMRPWAICIALIASLAVISPAFFSAASVTLRGPIPFKAPPAQAEMVDWVAAQTAPDAVFLTEPLRGDHFRGEGDGLWSGIERVLQRPTLVNFKFVPTSKTDLARWYQLILWREAVFGGACERIEEYPVEYLITRTRGSVDRLVDCTELVWQGEENTVLLVRP